jgi:hypothetical protein
MRMGFFVTLAITRVISLTSEREIGAAGGVSATAVALKIATAATIIVPVPFVKKRATAPDKHVTKSAPSRFTIR